MTHKWLPSISMILAILVTLAIIAGSLLPQQRVSDMVQLFPLEDLGAHAAAYAAFGCTWTCFFLSKFMVRSGINRKHAYTVTMIVIVISSWLLGLILELIQPFFERSSEFIDLIADMVGSLIGVALGYVVSKQFAKLVGDDTHDTHK